MDLDIDILRKCALFSGVSENGILDTLRYVGYSTRTCNKGEGLLSAGCENSRLGILLSGELEARKLSAGGDSFTVSRIKPSGVFGDVLAMSSYAKSPVDVRAVCASCAVLINVSGLYSAVGDVSHERMAVLRNLTCCIADKYFMLDSRLELLLEKGLRARIIHMLQHEEYTRLGYEHCTRTALAQYLACERTALARELTRMQNEGIIRCNRRKIELVIK